MNYPFVPSGAVGGVSPTRAETSGAIITAFDLVAYDTMGQVVPAISTTASSIYDVVGVAQTSVLALQTVSVFTLEGLRLPMRFLVAPGAGTNGFPVFLDSSAGAATLTPPTSSGNTIFRVGILQGADGVTTTPDVLYRPRYVSQIP